MNSVYLNTLLTALLGNQELVKAWWTTPNKAFDMQCPRDIDLDLVTTYLEGHCFG